MILLVQNGRLDIGVVECGNMFILSYIITCIDIILLYILVYKILKINKTVTKPLNINYLYKNKGDIMSLVYEITCAAPVDSDVIERRLTVTVNGNIVSTDSYSATSINLGEKSFNQGDNVILSLVDVDDVGNVSSPATVEFVAADTLPPSMPSIGVTLIREV